VTRSACAAAHVISKKAIDVRNNNWDYLYVRIRAYGVTRFLGLGFSQRV
jgi:hypothetical protein